MQTGTLPSATSCRIWVSVALGVSALQLAGLTQLLFTSSLDVLPTLACVAPVVLAGATASVALAIALLRGVRAHIDRRLRAVLLAAALVASILSLIGLAGGVLNVGTYFTPR